MKRSLKPFDVESFIKVVQLSGLVDDKVLHSLIKKFNDNQKFHIDDKDKMLGLVDFLIKQEVLTDWQSQKLLFGKHRGFICGDLVVQNFIRADEDASYYVVKVRPDDKTAIAKTVFTIIDARPRLVGLAARR